MTSPQTTILIETLLLLTVVCMHISKKNFTLLILYTMQSVIISLVLLYAGIRDLSLLLIIVALMTFLIKVAIAPLFFSSLINKNKVFFSDNSYLNVPLTLIMIAALTAFSYSYLFQPLTLLSPGNEYALLLTMAAMLNSIFLLINRKSAFSNLIGILSLENCIVAFANVAGLEVNTGLQIGILFDILIWIVIGNVFISMIYFHFGSLNVTEMKHLREE